MLCVVLFVLRIGSFDRPMIAYSRDCTSVVGAVVGDGGLFFCGGRLFVVVRWWYQVGVDVVMLGGFICISPADQVELHVCGVCSYERLLCVCS